VNHPRQPSFRLLFVAAGACALTGALCSPAMLAPHVAAACDAAYRVFVDAVSIVLEAGPFVLAGAFAAAWVSRSAHGGVVAALAAALAPGCDCSMNGFARALRGCPPPLAGFALTWGAACNPIALVATATVLGRHVLAARMAGALAAALAVAALWAIVAARTAPDETREACHADGGLAAHVATAVRLLLPAAILASLALVLLPNIIRTHATPFLCAAIGALLSPCSTADAVLAKVIGSSAPAQAAFVIASQSLDARQFVLLRRHYGTPRALLAWFAGAAGCATAALCA
jgi:uncharacterized membrane protein YraQ (UPF0718 family)